MAKIVVCGIAGRMGQRLGNLIVDSDDLQLMGGTERPGHEALGRDAGVVVGCDLQGVSVTEDVPAAEADVVIAFTAPESTLADARACAAAGTAMVVGTTGFTAVQLSEFKDTVSTVPCVFAPNFSTAMNVLFKLVEEAARILGDDYDVEVLEAHHRHKVDAPSGSALRLAERAAAGLERNLDDVVVHGREGVTGERTRQEIGMHAMRIGDMAGDHSVFYGAPGEYLELRHHATSRDAFALGALRAARFALTAKPGLYDMGHVLGL
ncbi:MAG TPA: 4-hydroxy-tetrahydrodipicolinate reductase [Candidatus Latescibacteria bacterium]|jgi:4-hydroxy-tetrahydrodipicolinate reductase|nr:4-hydroxy-tetrahydrodipicolinate reductase [Candidatus Latescibacterota bacterium]HJP30004.1 4-hydroxy-tetrahydrodipicolinate reductase [Candidatus Latescibacterota bacterium]